MVDLDNGVSIAELIDLLKQYRKYVTSGQLAELTDFVQSFSTADTPLYTDEGDLFEKPVENVADLTKEIQELVNFIKVVRKRVAAKGDTATAREIKDMIQASSSLFTMLTKMNEEITNQNRLRKIEDASIQAIRTLPEEQQQLFFTRLEVLLSE